MSWQLATCTLILIAHYADDFLYPHRQLPAPTLLLFRARLLQSGGA